MSKVSVIVPVYKAEEWLPQCLDSIRSQSYKDVELIVIEDPEGLGASYARNRGVARATGEFIVFCDADDYLEPDAIENLIAASGSADLVVGSFRKFGEFESVVQHKTAWMSMKEVASYVLGNLQNPRQNQILSGCWAKLYRRALVGRFPDLTTAEDMAFNFDYLTRCKSVTFISDIVYNNRKRTGSLSTTFDEKDKPGLFGFLEALTYVEGFLAPFYYGAKIKPAIDNSKVYHTALYFTRICQQTGWTMRDAMMRFYP